jgi:hypothetical protein
MQDALYWMLQKENTATPLMNVVSFVVTVVGVLSAALARRLWL